MKSSSLTKEELVLFLRGEGQFKLAAKVAKYKLHQIRSFANIQREYEYEQIKEGLKCDV